MNQTDSQDNRRIVLSESTADMIVGIVILTFSLFLLFVLIPSQIADTGKAFPYPRSFPRFCGYSLLLLSLVQIWQAYKKRGSTVEGGEVVFPVKGVGVAALALLILIVSTTLLNWLPYIPVTIVMLAVLMYLFGQRNKVLIGSVSVILPIAIYYFFTTLLKLVLP